MSVCDGITQTHSFSGDMLVMVYDSEVPFNKPALYRQYACVNCLEVRHKFLGYQYRQEAVTITKDKLNLEE